MSIVIRDRRKLRDIQEEFNTEFPYLLLEFFTPGGKAGTGHGEIPVRSADLTLADYHKGVDSSAQLLLTGEMTVAELDTQFRTLFGLGIHILRKSGKAWLKTTFTEGWSLNQQNKQGEVLSKLKGDA